MHHFETFVAINSDDCSFSKILLVINRDDFLAKNTKTTFPSGKSRWLKKSRDILETFVSDRSQWLNLFWRINRDDWKKVKTFWRLLLAINLNDYNFFATFASDKSQWLQQFFSNTLLPDCDYGPTAAIRSKISVCVWGTKLGTFTTANFCFLAWKT